MFDCDLEVVAANALTGTSDSFESILIVPTRQQEGGDPLLAE
jgi:hypothetical protein